MHAQTGSKSNIVLKLTSAPMSEAQPAGGDIYESEVEGGGCMNAQTGSKSNNVDVTNLAVSPVSVAQLRGRDIREKREILSKSKVEGGGCVNAQTGSKSNTVKRREEMKVSVAELFGKFGEVRQDGCKKCARLKSVRCGDCIRKLKYGGDISEECEVRTRHVRWTKPTFLTQTEG